MHRELSLPILTNESFNRTSAAKHCCYGRKDCIARRMANGVIDSLE